MEFNVKKTGIEEKLYELAKSITTELGYILYDCIYTVHSSTLQVFIMDEKTGTAVIEDCITVDRAFTEPCEAQWVPDNFKLEVGSPGMYRDLKTVTHFEDVVGETIACSISGKLSEEQSVQLDKKSKEAKKLRGILKQVTENKIIIDINNTDLELSFIQIKKANLDPDFQ